MWWFAHVLEHICYPDKLLTDIRMVLKKDGRFIVALPNIMHYKARMQLIMGNFNYNSQDSGTILTFAGILSGVQENVGVSWIYYTASHGHR
jgi:hypothetical protein